VTWVAQDTRDSVVDFIRYWSTLTELAVGCFVRAPITFSSAGLVSPRATSALAPSLWTKQ
jgi:hypothetical protein